MAPKYFRALLPPVRKLRTGSFMSAIFRRQPTAAAAGIATSTVGSLNKPAPRDEGFALAL